MCYCILFGLLNINQRTSGPVNAHLEPGPGIYFNALIHVRGLINKFENFSDKMISMQHISK